MKAKLLATLVATCFESWKRTLTERPLLFGQRVEHASFHTLGDQSVDSAVDES